MFMLIAMIFCNFLYAVLTNKYSPLCMYYFWDKVFVICVCKYLTICKILNICKERFFLPLLYLSDNIQPNVPSSVRRFAPVISNFFCMQIFMYF